MPEGSAVAASENGGVTGPRPGLAPPEEQNGFFTMVQSVVRMIFMYTLVKWVASNFMPGQNSNNQGESVSSPASTGLPNQFVMVPEWKIGVKGDLYVYIASSEFLEPSIFSYIPKRSTFKINHENTTEKFDETANETVPLVEPKGLLWKQMGISFGDLNDVRSEFVHLKATKSIQNNGSLWVHVFLVHEGKSPNPEDPNYDTYPSLYKRELLTRFKPKLKEVKKKNLVKGSSKSSDEEDESNDEVEESGKAPRPIMSYWWPNLTVSLVGSHDPIPTKGNPQVMKQIRLASNGFSYYPILYVNDFWMLSEHLNPINETVKTLPLQISFRPYSMMAFQFMSHMEESFRVQQETFGMEQSESETMKRMFLETNPILLGITMVVSLLHSIFDFLAFKNDIDFWRKKKDMEGLSFRTIVLNIVFQVIILLYLLDNETSWLILISNAAGVLIEIWKINKAVIIKRKAEFPYIEFIDRVKPSKLVAKTRKYDELAFKYLSYALYPLLVGYTIYSLVYEEHKSWYSFVVGTLVGFIYAFGFISMTPQLFINYKLKSVAHMPWKTFMYKALNTFIDDLFAFVIKMPMLHRIACLRDDVIFVVYLYQRWIYPEDKRRRNEFGQVGADGGDTDDEDDVDEKLLEELEKKDDQEPKSESKDTSTSKATSRSKKQVQEKGVEKTEKKESRKTK